MKKAAQGLTIMTLLFAFGCVDGKNPTSKIERRDGQSKNFTFNVNLDGPIEVGVVEPSGAFLFIMRNDIRCPGVIYRNGILEIQPSKTFGVAWEKGREVTRPAFAKRGIYKVLVSDNLETEVDNSFSSTFKIEITTGVENGSWDSRATQCEMRH